LYANNDDISKGIGSYSTIPQLQQALSVTIDNVVTENILFQQLPAGTLNDRWLRFTRLTTSWVCVHATDLHTHTVI